MSPDLSREHPEVPESFAVYGKSEAPRNGVIYALGPSPVDGNVIWAGTDDGLIQVTRDGGTSWSDVTPPEITSWSKISQIDPGHFSDSTAYVAVNRIRLDDMHPYVYRTHDGGVSWKLIVNGLPEFGPVNVVREDPERAGLLFAGTETAVFVSFDDGDQWYPLRLNMPASSVRDLVVHGDDLVVGTHGRSIWILDNITPLRQYRTLEYDGGHFLFEPQTATRVRWNMFSDTPLPPEEPAGENPPDGSVFDYYLNSDVSQVILEVRDEEGDLIRRFTSDDEPEAVDSTSLPHPTYWIRPQDELSTKAGMHRFVWDMRYPPPPEARRSYPIAAVLRKTPSVPVGPWVVPGLYTVRMTIDGTEFMREFKIRMDPRVAVSENEIRSQHDAAMSCYRSYGELAELRKEIAAARKWSEVLLKDPAYEGFATELVRFRDAAKALEGNVDVEDPNIHYASIYRKPVSEESFSGLMRKYLFVLAVVDGADASPTSQALVAIETLEAAKVAVADRWDALIDDELSVLNERFGRAGLQQIRID
jgi:hypothetical protein